MQNFLDAGKIFALISLGHRTHPSNYKPLDGWHESCYLGRREASRRRVGKAPMQQGQKTQRVKRVDGLNVSELRPGDVLLVHTHNGRYTIVYLGYGTARIFGSPDTGPVEEPATANILGSSWDGKSLVVGFIGEGGHLEVELPDRHEFISTSPIESIWRVGREPGFDAAARIRG